MKAPSVCTGVGIANSNASASVEHPQEADSEVEPRSKRARIIENTDIHTNTRCVCFETYDDDVKEANGHERIECSCG